MIGCSEPEVTGLGLVPMAASYSSTVRRTFSGFLIAAGLVGSTVAFGQPATPPTSAAATVPIPTAMSGRWTAVVPGGRTFTDTLSIVLDAIPTGPGAVKGRLTLRGVTCGAQDEPLAGTWDGSELRFESLVRPNVNTQLQNGQCASGRVSFVLKRSPDGKSFQGESTRDGLSTPSQISLAP